MISDTTRLDYLLKLLNSGGTNSLNRIAPDVCADWNREWLDFCLKGDARAVREDLQAKLKELGEQKYAIERKMQKVCKELEGLN